MAFSLRPLEDEDARVISDFPQSKEELSFFFPGSTYPLTPEQLLEGASERDTPTVALLNEQVVGYANFFKVRPNIYCTLGNLVVSPRHRRQGVATYLLNAMIQMAIKMYAVRFVRAACFSHNTAAYKLFHGMGFKPADMTPVSCSGEGTVLLVNMDLACRRK